METDWFENSFSSVEKDPVKVNKDPQQVRIDRTIEGFLNDHLSPAAVYIRATYLRLLGINESIRLARKKGTSTDSLVCSRKTNDALLSGFVRWHRNHLSDSPPDGELEAMILKYNTN